jgi:hypothetical protein
MRRSAAIPATLALLLLLAPACAGATDGVPAAGPSTAQPDTTPAPAIDPHDPSYDSIHRGAALGLTPEQSRARFDWTSDFNRIANWLSRKYPDLYADARITGESTGGQILFTTAIPDEARKLVRTLPVPIELRKGAAYNYKHLLGELERTYDRVWTTPGIVNGSGQIRADKSGLDITVTPDDGVDPDEFLVAAKTRAAQSTVPVTVTLSKNRRQGGPEPGVVMRERAGHHLTAEPPA